MSSRAGEAKVTRSFPGYPRCGSEVGFQRRAFAIQAAAAWCAIDYGSSSTPEQISARHQEITTACDRLDVMQSAAGRNLVTFCFPELFFLRFSKRELLERCPY